MNNISKLLTGGWTPIKNPLFGEQLQLELATENPNAFFYLILRNLVSLILIVGGVVFLFMILIGGIKWITSGGDKQSLESARGKITNAFIGLVIMISTFALIKVIESFFDISILTIDIAPLIIR